MENPRNQEQEKVEEKALRAKKALDIAKKMPNPEIASLLLERGADPGSQDSLPTKTAFGMAVEIGNERIKAALEERPDLQANDLAGKPAADPLGQAALDIAKKEGSLQANLQSWRSKARKEKESLPKKKPS